MKLSLNSINFHGLLIVQNLHLAVFRFRNRNLDLTLENGVQFYAPYTKCIWSFRLNDAFCYYNIHVICDFWSTYFKFETTWSWSSLLTSLCTNFPTNSDSYVIRPKPFLYSIFANCQFNFELTRHGQETDPSEPVPETNF